MNLPHVAKHTFSDQMGPNVQKPMPLGSPSHQGPKNCELSQNIFFEKLRPFLGPTGVIFAVFALLVVFSGWHTFFGVSGCTRSAKCNVGSRKTQPYFSAVSAVWHIQPYSQAQRPYSVMQSGVSPGSSVGNANIWILFLWSIVVNVCVCFRSATSHLVQSTPKHRFLTQNTTF